MVYGYGRVGMANVGVEGYDRIRKVYGCGRVGRVLGGCRARMWMGVVGLGGGMGVDGIF
jgi:hypothetical protein